MEAAELGVVMTSVVARDELVIREQVASFVAAMRAGDVAALVARYAPGAVSFTLAPPLVSGDVQDPEWLAGWFGTFEGPVDYEVRDLDVTVDGDVGFWHGVNRLSAMPRGRSERFDLWFRMTVGLRRVDGVWLVVHEHQSVPFHMDGSFRAAVGLSPEGVA